MKLKKIMSLCKKTNRVIIFQEWTAGRDSEIIHRQFISDGHAAYKVEGLPALTKETILRIFDIDEKRWDGWHCSVYDMRGGGIGDLDLNDTVPTEVEIDTFFCQMIINDKTLRIFGLPDATMMCVDEDLFNPLDSTAYRHYFARKTVDGATYLAVKNGLELEAIILPYDGITDARADEMKDLAYRMRETVNKMRFKNSIVDFSTYVEKEEGPEDE